MRTLKGAWGGGAGLKGIQEAGTIDIVLPGGRCRIIVMYSPSAASVLCMGGRGGEEGGGA